tara:strand:+ start:2147 stop:2908 length:762 start_codon:yes stop_codon:yes gene_type:complete
MKKLLTFLIGLVMIVSVLAGPPSPAPVKLDVTVNDNKISYDATATNIDTEEVLNIEIIGGVGIFDLNQFKVNPDPFIPMPFAISRNTIKIVACNVHPDCTTTFVVESFDPKTIRMDIQDASIPETSYRWVCGDGSTVDSEADCPVQVPEEVEVEVEVEKIVEVDVEKIVEVEVEADKPEPEDAVREWLIGLIAGIIGVFAWGAGFAGLIKYYLRKATEERKAGNIKLANKYRNRAEKMAKTVITNFLAGKYKK